MQKPIHRELKVSPDVLERLSAAELAELEAKVDNPNICLACGEVISGPSAEAVVVIDGASTVAILVHPSCMPSGVLPCPGLCGPELSALVSLMDKGQAPNSL